MLERQEEKFKGEHADEDLVFVTNTGEKYQKSPTNWKNSPPSLERWQHSPPPAILPSTLLPEKNKTKKKTRIHTACKIHANCLTAPTSAFPDFREQFDISHNKMFPGSILKLQELSSLLSTDIVS